MSARYRKRPVEVDTIQWTGDNIDELIDFTGGDFLLVNPGEGDFAPDVTAKVYDELHSTWVGVKSGQHVVRGVKGEYYPIAEDVFAETYERVDSSSAHLPPDVREAVRAALNSVQGTHHHLSPGTLRVLTERLTEALTPASDAADERVSEWGTQLYPHTYIARHARREDAVADIDGLRAHGESPRLLHRTVSYSAWTEVAR